MKTFTFLAILNGLLPSDARSQLSLPAQQSREGAYYAARDSAIKSLVARVKQGETYAEYIAPHDSALMSLAGRLRVIIGPVHAKGFSSAGRINLISLFPEDESFGKLDALVFKGDAPRTALWVTTRSLLSSWVAGKRPEIPRDFDGALREPEFYTSAIEEDAAVYRYASVTLSDSRALGVVQAMMIRVGQDDSPLPPDDVLVTVVRGRTVYILEAPTAVTIPPPRRCTAIRDSVRRSRHDDDAAWLEYRKCYNERVALNPAFAKIIAQVHSIAAALR